MNALNGIFAPFDFRVDEEQDTLIRQFSRRIKKIKEAHREKVIESVQRHVLAKQKENKEKPEGLSSSFLDSDLDSVSSIRTPVPLRLKGILLKNRASSVEPKASQSQLKGGSGKRRLESINVRTGALKGLESIGPIEAQRILEMMRAAELRGEKKLDLGDSWIRSQRKREARGTMEAALERLPGFRRMEESLEEKLAVDLEKTKRKLEGIQYPLKPTTPGVENLSKRQKNLKVAKMRPKFTLQKAKFLLPLPQKS